MNRTVSIALAVLITIGALTACSQWGGKSREALSDAPQGKLLADFFSGVKRVEGNPDSHFLLACYYQGRGRHRDAIDEFTKVIAIDPKNAQAFNRLGVSYDNMGKFQDAALCYQKALELDPSLYCVHNNMGYSQILQGDFKAAAASLRKALSMNDRNKTVHNNLELAYAKMQRPDLAMPEFEKGLGKPAALRNNARTSFEPAGPPAADKDLSGLNDVLMDVPAKALESPAGPQNIGSGSRFVPGGGIELSNGNGVRHMARHVGRYLKEKGFTVVRLTNAKRFNYKRADIAYLEGYGDEARRLARELPCRCDLKAAKKFSRSNVKIRVLIGKEMAPHKKIFKGGANWS